ncbi:hypothetical protein ACJX0J_026334, partial [Zea mays]
SLNLIGIILLALMLKLLNFDILIDRKNILAFYLELHPESGGMPNATKLMASLCYLMRILLVRGLGEVNKLKR